MQIYLRQINSAQPLLEQISAMTMYEEEYTSDILPYVPS